MLTLAKRGDLPDTPKLLVRLYRSSYRAARARIDPTGLLTRLYGDEGMPGDWVKYLDPHVSTASLTEPQDMARPRGW